MKNKTLTFRKLVMIGDLNAANSLFGGQLMKWSDEAAALYAMCQMKTQKIVTLKVSELLFLKPIKSGDFLEFYGSTLKVGKTSFTVKLEVIRKKIEDDSREDVFSCEMIFVSVDDQGNSVPHKAQP